MSKFKVGDQVRAVSDDAKMHMAEETGEIIQVDVSDPNLTYKVTYGINCRWFNDFDLELVPAYTYVRKGDTTEIRYPSVTVSNSDLEAITGLPFTSNTSQEEETEKKPFDILDAGRGFI